MKASDLFVRCLEAEGVERIFGVPGEENADFMISLKPEVSSASCSSESSCFNRSTSLSPTKRMLW